MTATPLPTQKWPRPIRLIAYAVLAAILVWLALLTWSAAHYPHIYDYQRYRLPLFVSLALAATLIALMVFSDVIVQLNLPVGPLLIFALGSAALLYWTSYPRRLPLSLANGMYQSSRFGVIRAKDGVLTTGDGSTRYIIEADKQGAYLLPERSVLLAQGRVALASSDTWSIELRLDNPRRPNSVHLLDASDQADFIRQP